MSSKEWYYSYSTGTEQEWRYPLLDRPTKLHVKLVGIIILKKKSIVLGFFLGLRTFSNVNVLHKGLLLQDWVFRLGMLQRTSVQTMKTSRACLFSLVDSVLNIVFVVIHSKFWA